MTGESLPLGYLVRAGTVVGEEGTSVRSGLEITGKRNTIEAVVVVTTTGLHQTMVMIDIVAVMISIVVVGEMEVTEKEDGAEGGWGDIK